MDKFKVSMSADDNERNSEFISSVNIGDQRMAPHDVAHSIYSALQAVLPSIANPDMVIVELVDLMFGEEPLITTFEENDIVESNIHDEIYGVIQSLREHRTAIEDKTAKRRAANRSALVGIPGLGDPAETP